MGIDTSRFNVIATSQSGRYAVVTQVRRYWDKPSKNFVSASVYDTRRERVVANVTSTRKTVRSAWMPMQVRGEVLLDGTVDTMSADLNDLLGLLASVDLQASIPATVEA